MVPAARSGLVPHAGLRAGDEVEVVLGPEGSQSTSMGADVAAAFAAEPAAARFYDSLPSFYRNELRALESRVPSDPRRGRSASPSWSTSPGWASANDEVRPLGSGALAGVVRGPIALLVGASDLRRREVARLDHQSLAVAVLPARLDEDLVDLARDPHHDVVAGPALFDRLDRDLVRGQRHEREDLAEVAHELRAEVARRPLDIAGGEGIAHGLGTCSNGRFIHRVDLAMRSRPGTDRSPR